jgi:hypothetical protein
MGIHPSRNDLGGQRWDDGVPQGGQLLDPVSFAFEEERKRPIGAKAIQTAGNPIIQATKIDASAPDPAVAAGGVGADEEGSIPWPPAWSANSDPYPFRFLRGLPADTSLS